MVDVCVKQVAGKYNVAVAGLYEASVLWGLRVRTLHNSEDELLAKFSGRISRNLRWNKMIHPIAQHATSEAARSSDQ